MDDNEQVAALLNSHNHLPRRYTASDISGDYIIDKDGDLVVGAVLVKNVSWYQCEIKHLVVRPSHRNRGIGTALIERAEKQVKERGRRLAHATIRKTNAPSIALFKSLGWMEVFRFENLENIVLVMQKGV